MDRMKHTGDYELDEINMLEQECADLEEENKRLEEENRKLKEEKEIRALNDRDNLIQIEKLEKENKKLKAELDKYKKQYEHIFGDDELIYEEGLYD